MNRTPFSTCRGRSSTSKNSDGSAKRRRRCARWRQRPSPRRRREARYSESTTESHIHACKLKLRLRELTSCLCSTAAPAVCFEGRMLGLDTTETGNELSQPKFEFKSLGRMSQVELYFSIFCILWIDLNSITDEYNVSVQSVLASLRIIFNFTVVK